jgi:site-specific DNA-methyltransferase (adenine-specific)
MRKLYFGDNLDILRQVIPAESVDLVYLDPPFNSSRAYNIFFQSPPGEKASEAQAMAFKDTWSWSIQSEHEYDDVIHSEHPQLADMLSAMRRFMRESSMMAYLVMMTNRVIELHRVLKPTGNFFLHCDTTASAYLRIILDTLFDPSNFRNQIIWKRTSSHNDARRKLGMVTDHIFFYGKTEKAQLFPVRQNLKPQYVEKFYRHIEEDGRRYRLGDMASPRPRPNLMYEWMGYPHPKKGWRYSRETMQELHEQGRIFYPEDKSQRLMLKRYLDENEGQIIHDLWEDINPLQSQSREYLGYPTQKPQKLLERIISLASKPGDTILDPFCGCGTAVHAAESLGRAWIGIDVSHLAITLIEQRMENAFPEISFEVEGRPKDLSAAQDLFKRDPFQFEWWACSLVRAQPANKQKKGADKGVDGVIYFSDWADDKVQTHKIIISIKGGGRVGVAQVRDLIGAMQSHQASMAFFLSLTPPTREMLNEAAIQGFYEAGNGQKYPRVQIFTISDLIEGTVKPAYFDMSRGGQTFKKAPVEKVRGQQDRLI